MPIFAIEFTKSCAGRGWHASQASQNGTGAVESRL